MPQVIRIEIRARPSKVWRYVASQEAPRRWISANLEIDLKLGGKYRFLDGFAGIGDGDWSAMVADHERGADQHRILDKLAGLVNASEN